MERLELELTATTTAAARRALFGWQKQPSAALALALAVKRPVARGHGNERVFECKTCRRRFLSFQFQALGGHRASHKKPRQDGGEGSPDCRPKMHGCAVCGVEFAVGKALKRLAKKKKEHQMMILHADAGFDGCFYFITSHNSDGGVAGWLTAWVGLNPNQPESTLIPNGRGSPSRPGSPRPCWALPRDERKAWAIGPSCVGLRTQNPLLIACWAHVICMPIVFSPPSCFTFFLLLTFTRTKISDPHFYSILIACV